MSQVKVLMVCTGNICRSPTAEGVLRHKLEEAGLGDRVLVDSAGTIDYHSGDPPDSRAVEQARRRGYDLSGQRARQLRHRDFEDFDLILCMDRGHLSQLRRNCPEARRDRLRLFLEFAPDLGLSEVPDPYYGGLADYDYALDLIEPGVAGLIEVLWRDFL